MIRRALAIAAAAAAVFISGCATDPAVAKAQADAQVMAGQVRVAEANRDAEEARAVQALAAKVDSGGAAAYLIAKAMKGLSTAPVQVVQREPESLLGLAWRSLLQVADIALRGYGIRTNRDVSLAATSANRDVSLASYATFAQMGSQIAAAGIAGYPFIQTPQPNVTLSGTGVIGSGTYTGPVTTTTTTTRNCNGGTAAPGGNSGTTGQAGSGGGAPGGTC